VLLSKPCNAFADDLSRRFGVSPTGDLSLLLFQRLVNGEKVLNATQGVLKHLVNVVDLFVERIALHYGENLLVTLAPGPPCEGRLWAGLPSGSPENLETQPAQAHPAGLRRALAYTE
jgi:hypothetical protein